MVEKEEIMNKLLNGELKLYEIDKFTENTREAVDIRREFLEEKYKIQLTNIAN